MANFSFKHTVARGFALALPLGVVIYFLIKFIQIFEKLIAPLAKRFGVDSVFGSITITLLAIITILVTMFILGLLMQIPFVAKSRNYIEEWILKFVPSLNHLKLMAADKLNLQKASFNWKPVLFQKDGQYIPAYIIEENGEWIILSVTKPPTTEPTDMLIVKKSAINYKEITMDQMHDFNKHFGKGYLSLIN